MWRHGLAGWWSRRCKRDFRVREWVTFVCEVLSRDLREELLRVCKECLQRSYLHWRDWAFLGYILLFLSLLGNLLLLFCKFYSIHIYIHIACDKSSKIFVLPLFLFPLPFFQPSCCISYIKRKLTSDLLLLITESHFTFLLVDLEVIQWDCTRQSQKPGRAFISVCSCKHVCECA